MRPGRQFEAAGPSLRPEPGRSRRRQGVEPARRHGVLDPGRPHVRIGRQSGARAVDRHAARRLLETHAQERRLASDLCKSADDAPAAVLRRQQRPGVRAQVSGHGRDVVLAQLQALQGEGRTALRRIGQASCGVGQPSARLNGQAPREIEVQRGARIDLGLEAVRRQPPGRHVRPHLRQSPAARRRKGQGAAAQPPRPGLIDGRTRGLDRQDAAVGRPQGRVLVQADRNTGPAHLHRPARNRQGEGPQRPLHLAQVRQVLRLRRAEQWPGAVTGRQAARRRQPQPSVLHQIQVEAGPRLRQPQVAEDEAIRLGFEAPRGLQRRAAPADRQSARPGVKPVHRHARRGQTRRPPPHRAPHAPAQRTFGRAAQFGVAFDADVGAPRLKRRPADLVRSQRRGRAARQAKGFKPAAGRAVEAGPHGRLGHARPADRQSIRLQRRLDHRAPIAPAALQVGIGQIAGEAEARAVAAGPLGAESGRRGVEPQGDPVPACGQVDVAGQAVGLRRSAFQRRRRHAGDQPHQLAVLHSGVAARLDRAVLGIEPQPSLFDDHQRGARIRARRPAGEALHQGIQRSERQLAFAPARPHHWPQQANAAGRDAKTFARPGRADGVVDLHPLDHHVGVAGIADADATDKAVQLDPFHLDFGGHALTFQPSDQHLARGDPAVQIGQRQQHKQNRRRRGDRGQRARGAGASGGLGRRRLGQHAAFLRGDRSSASP